MGIPIPAGGRGRVCVRVSELGSERGGEGEREGGNEGERGGKWVK